MEQIIKVSVILPVYNGELHLKTALDSIINQTYKNLEVICIDDGSTDSSKTILESINDKRVKVISRENRGLIKTLNEGLSVASGQYIARMDADDVAYPARIENQVKFMLDNPGISVVGTAYNRINEKGDVIGFRKPPKHSFLNRAMLIYGSPLCHPSVMFNVKLLSDELYYSDECRHCEDFELWFRLMAKGHKIANIDSVFFDYRILESSVSSQNSEEQMKKNYSISEAYTGISSQDIKIIRHGSICEKIGVLKKNFIKIYHFAGIIGVIFCFLYSFRRTKNVDRC